MGLASVKVLMPVLAPVALEWPWWLQSLWLHLKGLLGGMVCVAVVA